MGVGGGQRSGATHPVLKEAGGGCVVIQVILGAKEGANQRETWLNPGREGGFGGGASGHLKELILKSAVCRNCTVLLL